MITQIPVSLGERLLSLLFPPRCLLCEELVPAGRLFCGSCEARLPEEPCRRSVPLDGGAELPVAAAFPYEAGFRDALHRYKFKGRYRLAKPLGFLMVDAARIYPHTFHCVTYVPLSKKGRRARGYDQCELLAVQISKLLGVPVRPLLEKAKSAAAQHELNEAQRRENAKTAYRCTAKESLNGLSVLLIDDIVTTGATLGACAQLLYEAGAWSVCGLCAASTPRPVSSKGRNTGSLSSEAR